MKDMKAHSGDGKTSAGVNAVTEMAVKVIFTLQINILLQSENTGAQLEDISFSLFLRNKIKANQSLSEYPLKCFQSDGACLHERGKQTREGHEGSL